MKKLSLAIAICLFYSAVQCALSQAAIPRNQADRIIVRSGNHKEFVRVVFEGKEELISKGAAGVTGRDILVSFGSGPFRIIKRKIPFKNSVVPEGIVMNLLYEPRIRTFTLSGPPRLVVDIFRTVPHKKRRKPTVVDSDAVHDKKSSVSGEKLDAVKKDPEGTKEAEKNTGKSAAGPVAKKGESSSGGSVKGNIPDEAGLIPDKLKSMWTLLESGNFYAVLKELPNFKPDDVPSRAAYYYILARADRMSGQLFDAVKHLRLAYIYASDKGLKELALLRRAEVYTEQKLFREARADYIMLIKQFPDSANRKITELGLAESLYHTDMYREALPHYRESGSTGASMFGLANCLQKMGKTDEARDAYVQALKADRAFAATSPETTYLMGENMFMTGNLEGAKKQLLPIDFGPYKDKAAITLGIIAMKEANMDEAFRNLRAASRTLDKTISAEALFNLSLALIKDGRFQDAANTLEEIRHRHMESRFYKDTLLVLSKLMAREGKTKNALYMLKELIYGKQPPAEAFNEIEKIILASDMKGTEEGLSTVEIWKEVGQWMVDERREDFLVKVAEKLRHNGRPFITLCDWLIENASARSRGHAALGLADYYISIGNADMSESYITIASKALDPGDAILRVAARIDESRGMIPETLQKIVQIHEPDSDDIRFLADVLMDYKEWSSEPVMAAIQYFEDIVRTAGCDAETCLSLADITYASGMDEKALYYYDMVYRKDPENAWALYRLGRGKKRPESENLYTQLRKEDNLFGEIARSKLMEMSLDDKVREVY